MNTSAKNECPLEFRKRDLAVAVEHKTGTPLFYPNGRLMGDRLRRILFSEKAMIEELGWTEDLYKDKFKFLGNEARILCRHLQLTRANFVGKD